MIFFREKNKRSLFLKIRFFVLRASLIFSIFPFLIFFKNADVFSKNSKKETFQSTRSHQIKNQKEASKSQSVVSTLEEEREQLLQAYKVILVKTDSRLKYNESLRKLIQSQEDRFILIEDQIESLKQTQSSIMPLMVRMIHNLEQFIGLDRPFLMKERKNRLQGLKDIIHSAEVSSSEKFRKIMEAYQIENEYGRTLEAYKGVLQLEGKESTVDFLRLGRIAFIYQTLDGKKRGIWNQELKKWMPLRGRGYKEAITQSIKVALKQRAPDILKFPIPAPERLTLDERER